MTIARGRRRGQITFLLMRLDWWCKWLAFVLDGDRWLNGSFIEDQIRGWVGFLLVRVY